MRERGEHDSPHLNLTKCTNCRGRGSDSDSSSGSTWARALSLCSSLSPTHWLLSLSLFAHVNKRVCSRNKFLHCRSHHVAGFGLFWFSAEARRGELCLQLWRHRFDTSNWQQRRDDDSDDAAAAAGIALRCVVALLRCCGEFRKYVTNDLGNELDSAWLGWTTAETLSKHSETRRKNLLILNFVLKALSANCCSFAKPHICLALKSA